MYLGGTLLVPQIPLHGLGLPEIECCYMFVFEERSKHLILITFMYDIKHHRNQSREKGLRHIFTRCAFELLLQ